MPGDSATGKRLALPARNTARCGKETKYPAGPESTEAMMEKYPDLKDRTLYILTEDPRR